MDDPALAGHEHDRALRGLARINFISATANALWPPIRRLAASTPQSPLTVLDVAAGGADVPLRLAARARAADVPLEWHACDISPRALEFARARAAEADITLHCFPHDVLAQPLPDTYDVIICALFLHHLTEADAVRAMRALAARTRRLLLISDLRRSPLGWIAAAIGTRTLTRSPTVHTDGLRSVRAAFTQREARTLADRAGLHRARISAHWPWRWLLEWQP